jgi:hypothetical protein
MNKKTKKKTKKKTARRKNPTVAELFISTIVDLSCTERQLKEALLKVKATEAMGYEWVWSRSIDSAGNQEGAWHKKEDIEY